MHGSGLFQGQFKLTKNFKFGPRALAPDLHPPSPQPHSLFIASPFATFFFLRTGQSIVFRRRRFDASTSRSASAVPDFTTSTKQHELVNEIPLERARIEQNVSRLFHSVTQVCVYFAGLIGTPTRENNLRFLLLL